MSNCIKRALKVPIAPWAND